ncbi:MAG: hypothetical protein ACC655_03050, partial [Rhodothermia bacterium]
MTKFYQISASLFLMLILPLSPMDVALAQAPELLSFQGQLTDNLGVPIDTPSVSMKFTLYRGLTPVWTETQNVTVQLGGFAVKLGQTTPLDTVGFDASLRLGLKVGSDPEMTPDT